MADRHKLELWEASRVVEMHAAPGSRGCGQCGDDKNDCRKYRWASTLLQQWSSNREPLPGTAADYYAAP